MKDPKEMTWDDIDEIGRQVGAIEDEIAQTKLDADERIRAIQQEAEAAIKAKEAIVKSKIEEAKKAFNRLKKELGEAKSKDLAFVIVGTRTPAPKLNLQSGVTEAQAIMRAETLGANDVIQVDKRIRKEVLEVKPAKVIAEVGYYWTDPKPKFFFETKRAVGADKRRVA